MLSDCEEGFQGLFIENTIGILGRVVGHEGSCAENLGSEQLELNGKLTDECMSGICDGEPGEWGEEEVRVRVLGEVKGIFPMPNPARRQSENDVSSRCGTWFDTPTEHQDCSWAPDHSSQDRREL